MQSGRTPFSLSEMTAGNSVVYNDKNYTFTLNAPNVSLPPLIYINEDVYDTELIGQASANSLTFRLRDADKPFLTCFGAVHIEFSLNGTDYYSENISVMVSNTTLNNNVLNMIEYIYTNGEKYLYEEHQHSMISAGTKPDEIISLEAKLHFLQKIAAVYHKVYPVLKINHYAQLKKTESTGAFHKLTGVSVNTVRYIATHADELTAAAYDTGIRFNGQYYQPRRVLIEQNTPSNDVYENRVIVGFLKTVTEDIRQNIRSLRQYAAHPYQPSVNSGYVNSMLQIFSHNMKRINHYIVCLEELQKKYQELYFFYSRLLDITPEPIHRRPQFTAVFRSISSYRQLFEIICQWFSVGAYDLTKDDYLLTFVASDKIYEYYCLVKMLHYLDQHLELKKAERFVYPRRYPGEQEICYANTFTFANRQGRQLTLWYQPVIYGNDPAVNGIQLYRNTSSSVRSENNSRSAFYTPDYLISFESGGQTRYLILDAKFSFPWSIRRYQLQELVYKYLFSFSSLNADGQLAGLYILCGKSTDADHHDIVHDIAAQQYRTVTPFAELILLGGKDTQDTGMMKDMFDKELQRMEEEESPHEKPFSVEPMMCICQHFGLMLKEDGHVEWIGPPDSHAENRKPFCAEDWTGIIRLYKSEKHIVGLKNDGTVVACGNNDKNQCETDDWRNIREIYLSDESTAGVDQQGTVYHTYTFREDPPVVLVSHKTADAAPFDYAENADGSLTVMKYTGQEKAVVIPPTIKGKNITAIGSKAFSECDRLTSVTIPDSVTGIGERAFEGCEGLTTVTISDSVTSIGNGTFEGCEGLTAVTLSNSMTHINDWAFAWCKSLSAVTIPDSVTSIGNGAFAWCRSLSAVTIPDSVTNIGAKAFSECSDLTSITIPDSVTHIGDEAFAGCCALTICGLSSGYAEMYAKDHNIPFHTTDSPEETTGESPFDYEINDEGILTIVKYTGHEQAVTIPQTIEGKAVTAIGKEAFCRCESLTSVTIPDSVTYIGNWAFAWCKNLLSVTISNSVTCIGNWAFAWCNKITSVTVPDSVTNIGVGAFAWCNGLVSVDISDSVASIGVGAFRGCHGLTICGSSLSYAEKYAEKQKIAFSTYEDQ